MIAQIVSDVLTRIGHTWKAGGSLITPQPEDVSEVLDEAARVLYDSDTGTRLETGGLIIEKRPSGHDVFVYVGNYE